MFIFDDLCVSGILLLLRPDSKFIFLQTNQPWCVVQGRTNYYGKYRQAPYKTSSLNSFIKVYCKTKLGLLIMLLRVGLPVFLLSLSAATQLQPFWKWKHFRVTMIKNALASWSLNLFSMGVAIVVSFLIDLSDSTHDLNLKKMCMWESGANN